MTSSSYFPHGDTFNTSVIMVTYNSEHVLRDSVGQLYEDPCIEMIVFDNDSKDSTREILSSDFPAVRVISSSSNLGFARAVNRAIAEASFENIVLLNPDAIVSSAVIGGLSERLSDPGVGIVAPNIAHPGGRLRITSAGRFPGVWRMLCHYTGISRILGMLPIFEGHYLRPEFLPDGEVDTEWVTGACLGFRRSTWSEVGGLSERWFMYAEDVDFCFRVKQCGKSVRLLPSLRATHLVGGSDSTQADVIRSDWILNLFDFYRVSMSKSLVNDVAWGMVVGAGLLTRSLAYVGLSVFRRRKSWLKEARRFAIHSIRVGEATINIMRSARKNNNDAFEATQPAR